MQIDMLLVMRRRITQGLFLLLLEGMTAYVIPPQHLTKGRGLVSRNLKDSSSKISAERCLSASSNSVQLRMMQSDDLAVQSLKNWPEIPQDSKIVSCSSSSDAAVMSTFFSEFRKTEDSQPPQTIIVSKDSNLEAMSRICSYLRGICPQAKVGMIAGAPQPCISFSNMPKPLISVPSKAKENIGEKEVMGKILDWFTQLLIEMDDEEEYVNVGRRLLSVNRYTVDQAASIEGMHEVFWKEVASVVEGRDGNILIALPEFMVESPKTFHEIIENQLKTPLTQWAAGDKQGEQLRVEAYHPMPLKEGADAQGPPWPLIQIYAYDPAPPAEEMEASFNDVLEQPPPAPKGPGGGSKATFPLNLSELTDTSEGGAQ